MPGEQEIKKQYFYKEWLSSQGIPIIEGYFVEDVYSLELEPWQSKGGKGVMLNLVGAGESNDARSRREKV